MKGCPNCAPKPAPEFLVWDDRMSDAGNLAAALTRLLQFTDEVLDDRLTVVAPVSVRFAQARLDHYLGRVRNQQADRRWTH